MPRSDESFGDRMRKITWLQWGLLCLLGAGFSQVGSELVQGPAPDRASAAGRAAGGLLFVVVGVVLIVLHFARPKRTTGKTTKANTATHDTRRPPAPDRPGLPPRAPSRKRP